MPGARVLAASVQALEDPEDPVRVTGFEADPVVDDADLHIGTVSLALDADHRRPRPRAGT